MITSLRRRTCCLEADQLCRVSYGNPVLLEKGRQNGEASAPKCLEDITVQWWTSRLVGRTMKLPYPYLCPILSEARVVLIMPLIVHVQGNPMTPTAWS